MGTVEWSVLIVAMGMLITLGGVVVRLMDRLNKAEGKADAAETKASGVAISITATHLEIERVENDLVEHRVAMARDYVSKATLESLETRIVEAINRLGDRLDKLFVRTQ